MELPSNYQHAVDWIDSRLLMPTMEIKKPGVYIQDLNHYLTNIKSRILHSEGFAQNAAFMQVKIIKDNL